MDDLDMDDEFVINDEFGKALVIVRCANGKIRALVDDDAGEIDTETLNRLSLWLQGHGYGKR